MLSFTKTTFLLFISSSVISTAAASPLFGWPPFLPVVPTTTSHVVVPTTTSHAVVPTTTSHAVTPTTTLKATTTAHTSTTSHVTTSTSSAHSSITTAKPEDDEDLDTSSIFGDILHVHG